MAKLATSRIRVNAVSLQLPLVCSLIFAYRCWVTSYHVSILYDNSIGIGWSQRCAKYVLIKLLQYWYGIQYLKRFFARYQLKSHLFYLTAGSEYQRWFPVSDDKSSKLRVLPGKRARSESPDSWRRSPTAAAEKDHSGVVGPEPGAPAWAAEQPGHTAIPGTPELPQGLQESGDSPATSRGKVALLWEWTTWSASHQR